MKFLKWGLLMVAVLLIGNLPAQGQTPASVNAPAVTVLQLDGVMTMARPGWREALPVLPGTLITAADIVFPEEAELRIMCPDGSVDLLLPTDLLPRDTIQCDVDPSTYIVGEEGERRISITRGGRQDPTVPYLISPRATVVSQPEVTLRWHAPPDVLDYSVTVRGDGVIVWSEAGILPEDVVANGVASLPLSIELEEDVPYSVEICVLFEDLRSGCTSDPGWQAGVDVAFYYRPAPNRSAAINGLTVQLSQDSAESLYAAAVLLSQTVFEPTPGTPIGYYSEAIQALEQLYNKYPASALATSPETRNLLGSLYYSVNLPRSAAQQYQLALNSARPGTEAAALAALGRARTAGPNAIEFYDLAVEHYAVLLDENQFQAQLSNICATMGDLCSELARCTDVSDTCN